MAIQQHPIPQNVTQYQFRLVGDMTLKQFLQLAGGIVLAVVIYALPLPVFFKWPLIAIAAGAGAGMAFLPVEGRPMDQWILAFIRSIYQPTIYVWEKSAPTSTTPETKKAPSPTPQPSLITVTTSITPSTPAQHITVGPVTETIPSQPFPVTQKEPLPTVLSAPTLPPTPEKPTTTPLTRSPQSIFTAPPRAITVEKQTPLASTTLSPTAGQPVAAPQTPTPTPTPSTPVPKPSLLPIPHPPQTPNTIVGMTLTPGGSILDSAIVEIIQNRSTVRATKSNKLGQFLFAKPLDDGQFQITAEKQGYTFPTYSLNLTGQVVQPIALKATSQTTITPTT